MISLTGLSFAENILVLSNKIGRWLLTPMGLVQFIIIIGIAFIVMYFIVFRKGRNEGRKDSHVDGHNWK